jgi:hypothetical protein
LADTGLDLSIPLIAIGVLLVGAGIALFVVKKGKRKGAAGAAALSLLLFGMLVVGTTSAAPARAATPDGACTTTSAPTPATPIQTPTPTAAPTPTPTCAPSSIDASIDRWGGIPADGSLQFQGDVTDPALLSALGSHSFDGVHGTVAVTDTESGDPVFSGDVIFGYDAAIPVLLIPGAQLQALAGADSDWPFDQETTLKLSFDLTGSNDCPITVSVTGPAMGTE